MLRCFVVCWRVPILLNQTSSVDKLVNWYKANVRAVFISSVFCRLKVEKTSLHHVTREDSVVVSGHGVPIYWSCKPSVVAWAWFTVWHWFFFLIVVHKIVNTSFGCVLCRSTGTGQGKRKKIVPSWCRLSMRWEYFSYGKCQSRELCPLVDSLLYVLSWVVVM